MQIPLYPQKADQYAVSPEGQILFNCVVSSTGVRLRPGSEERTDTGSGAAVDGISDWSSQQLTIVVSGGNVYKIAASDAYFGSYLLLEDGGRLILEDGSGYLLLETDLTATDVTGDSINSGTRAIFAEYGNGTDQFLYIANGGQILELHPSTDYVSYDDGGGSHDYQCLTNNINSAPAAGGTSDWDDLGAGTTYSAWSATVRYGSGNADALEDTSWPTTVKWVAVIDKYLFAIEDGTQNVYQSVVEQPWNNNGGVFQADQVGDDATAMRVWGGSLFVAGDQSIQIFENDGVSDTFIPSNYGAITHGVLAPYSFLNSSIEPRFFYIDNNRRLVYLNGRDPVVVNEALNTYLAQVPFIDDAIADMISLDGMTHYVLRFPTAKKTVSVNMTSGTWTEWSYNASGLNQVWQANCISYIPRWDMVIAGDFEDGTLKEISSNFSDDDGTAITGTIRTPRIRTANRTRVSDLIVSLARVAKNVEVGESSFRLRWRDDGGDWSAWRTVTISDNTETDCVKHIRRLGSFRNARQYEFDISNLWPFAIDRVEQI